MKMTSTFSRYCGAIVLGCCLSASALAVSMNQSADLNYTKLLNPNSLSSNPLAQLVNWQNQAQQQHNDLWKIAELATVKDNGSPAARTITIQNITNDGIVFETQTSSNKVKEFSKNNHVALVFVWQDPVSHVTRQVRVEGTVLPSSQGLNNGLSSANQEKGWQNYVISPLTIEFSLVQTVNDKDIVEYVLYNKMNEKWVKSTKEDYLAQHGF